MKSTVLISLLTRKGATVVEGRGKGSHTVVRFNGHQTTIPHNRDLPLGTLKAILKQLDTSLEELAGK